jgi:hypothetical protein
VGTFFVKPNVEEIKAKEKGQSQQEAGQNKQLEVSHCAQTDHGIVVQEQGLKNWVEINKEVI